MNKKRFTFLWIFVLIASFAFAQEANDSTKAKKERYKSLFWEITKPGMEKPSYIYSAPETSSKIAYHLSDTFYLALREVDLIAVDYDPDTLMWMWQDPETRKEILELRADWWGMPGRYYNYSSLYTSPFRFDPLSREELQSVLSNRFFFFGSMFGSSVQSDFSESMSVQDFISKAGMKLGKDIGGLYDYIEDLQYQKDASDFAEKIERENKKNEKRMRDEYKKRREVYEKLNEAYRRGDLGLMDSLYRELNPYDEVYTRFYYPRAAKTAQSLDSLMQKQSVFTAVNFILMPGDSGVISNLRHMGYTVRPITHVLATGPNQLKQDIEDIRKKVKFDEFISGDELFSIKKPTHFKTELYGDKMPDEFYFEDPVNDASYEVERLQTYAPLTGQSPEYIIQRLDSMTYEFIPGTILKHKKFKFDGYPAYDVINKTITGDLQRFVLVVTPIEIMVFRVSGKEDYIKKSKVGKKFIKSIKLNISDIKGWKTIAPSHGEFKFIMPAYTLADTGDAFSVTKEKEMVFQGWDENDKSYYYFKRTLYHDHNWVEEDTFDLNYMTEKLAEELSMEIKNRNLGEVSGFPSIMFELRNEDKTDSLKGKLVNKGFYYYLMLAKPGTSDKTEKFFSSLELVPFNVALKFDTVQDTALYYSVISPVKKGEVDQKNSYSYYSYYYNDDDIPKDYKSKSKSSTYFCDKTGEFISVDFHKFNRYKHYPSADSLWNEEIIDALEDSTMFVRTKKLSVKDSIQILDFEITDTNTTKYIRFRHILVGGRHYKLSVQQDERLPESEFVETFFSTFAPRLDTVVELSPLEDKGMLFLRHIASDDTTAREQAFKSDDYITFEDHHADSIMYLMDHLPTHLKKKLQLRTELITALGDLKNPNILPWLEKKFNSYTDTMALQFSVLIALSNQQTEEANQLLIKLMDQDLPLTTKSYTTRAVFSPYYDNIEKAESLYPALFKYTRYPEYDNYIYFIFRNLVDSNIVDINQYPEEIEIIRKNTEIEFRRQMNKEQEEESEYYWYDQGAYNHELLNYVKTLYPLYHTNPKVKTYFERVLQSTDLDMRRNMAVFMARKDLPVHDSIWTSLCKEREYRANLYGSLKKINKLEFFDTTYISQKDIAESILYGSSYDDEKDSVEYIGKRLVKTPFTEGYVYFFKAKGEYDDEWKLGVIGIMPSDTTKIILEPEYKDKYEIRLYHDDDMDEIMDDEIKKFRIHRRNRLWSGSSDYDYYGSAVEEVVF